MDPRPVGVFDSGVGGLTVLHECLVTMPHEDFVYLGDHARLPYGPRPLEEVRGFAREIAGYLEGREGAYRFLTTGEPSLFRELGERFLQLPLGEIEQVAVADLEAVA